MGSSASMASAQRLELGQLTSFHTGTGISRKWTGERDPKSPEFDVGGVQRPCGCPVPGLEAGNELWVSCPSKSLKH